MEFLVTLGTKLSFSIPMNLLKWHTYNHVLYFKILTGVGGLKLFSLTKY